MNENLNLPKKLTVDVTNPPGQRIRWVGQTSSGAGWTLLERNRSYRVMAFNVTRTMVFVKLEELPHAWFEASAFDEVTDGRS